MLKSVIAPIFLNCPLRHTLHLVEMQTSSKAEKYSIMTLK